MERAVEVEILKMVDPGCYLLKEMGLGEENRLFDELCLKMDAYFNSEAFISKAVTPVLGQNYIGKERDKWYRVRVNQIIQRTTGPHASCYLLDYGKDCVMIPLRWLRECKDEFFKLPYLVKTCVLHNIHPITLLMDNELNTRLGPAHKWDESSTVFMKDIFQRAKSWRASFLSHSDGKYKIELYALDGINTLNINDLLVRQEYAAYNNQLEAGDPFDIASHSEKSPREDRTADRSGLRDINSNSTKCVADAADSLMTSNAASVTVNALGRGNLLQSLITGQSTPLVGLKATERVSMGTRLDGSLSPGSTMHMGSSPSPSYSVSSGSERESRPTPGAAFLSRTGGAVSSGSEREYSSSPGGDVRCSRTLRHSPGGSLSVGSGGGTRQSTGVAVSQEHKSPQEPSNLSPAIPEISPVQSLIKSRLPKHLKSSIQNTTPAVSAPLDFVMPNTNSSKPSEKSVMPNTNAQSLRKRSPVENSKPEVAMDRPGTAEVREVASQPSLKSGSEEVGLQKEVKRFDVNEPHLSSRLALPSASCDTSRQLTAEDLEILVDGSTFVKCVTDIGSQPFADLVQNTPGLYDINRPTKLQSFTWPSVMRGLDVIGICQSRNKDGSPGGKTLAYLFPLISLLNFRSTYKDLPKFSTSPYVLILCPHWDLVLDVHDQCQRVLNYQDKLRLHQIRLRVYMLFGGGGDENQEVNLINGCEILVSTPSSFLRMMEKKLISFKRVSHLVLEDADILMDQFKPELDKLMSQYKLELNERQGGSAPQQVLIFSQRWTPSIKEFSLENQVCPVVVVAAKMESAYYGQVKQKPLMCLANQRYNQVLSLLASKKKKVLIFASDTTEAKKLYEIARAASVYTLLAHDEMNSSDLAKVNRDWNLPHRDDSQPVLVLTDTALSLLSISDACWVIHFDVPSELEVFANRLWCLRKYYERYEDKTECIVDECVSFIFITEECWHLSSRLIRVLQRCGESIPAELAKMSEKHMEAREKGKRSLLCNNLKNFGFCRNQNLCYRRHKVFSSLDEPGLISCYIKLPTEGNIKVWIKHVVDASFYYVQLTEHRDLDGNVTNLRIESANLAMEMAHHFGRASNQHHPETAEPSQLFAKEDIQHIFHRVEVLNVFSSDTANYPDLAQVFYVDIGQTCELPIAELYELPPHLAQIPYQAVEVFVCRIKPVDRDVKWTKKASVYLSEIIENQILEGNIVLSLGNSLWLDPLVKRDWLEDKKVCQTIFTVRSLLLDANYADENPKHLERLYKACEGIIQLPAGVSTAINTTHAYTDDGRLILTKTEEFPDCDIDDVYVTAAWSPDLLYVQLASNEKELNQLNEDINRMMLVAEDRKKNLEPKKGLLVLAKHPATSRWCRARIEVVTEGKLLQVLFVDTGITEDLPCEDLVPMPLHFKQFPFQAIECSLIGLESDVGGYMDASVEEILALTGKANGEMAKVRAQVVRKTEARYTGRHHYGVNLYNITSALYHVNVASHLVVTNYAHLSSDKLKELYPLAYDDRSTSVAHRISKLCRNILESRNAEVRRENALELHIVTRDFCFGTDSRTGLVALVGQTLEYTWELEPAEALLMSLQLLVKDNPSHCMELEENDIWDTLCHIFVKHESNNLLDDMLLVLESMLTCLRCCEMFVQRGGLWFLGHVLRNSQLDFVIRMLSQLIQTTLVNTRDSGLTTGHLECLKGAIHHLTSQDPAIIDICLQVIKHLARSKPEHKDLLRKYGGIRALCEKVVDWPDTELVSKGIELLTILATDNRFNRDDMVKWSAGNVLNKLTERPDLNMETRRLCADLMRRIRTLLPLNQLEASEKNDPMVNGSGRSKQASHQKIHNRPIPKERLNIVSESRRPFVRWTQSSWDILLTVEVKDAQNSPDIALFTEDSLQFQAVSMSTEYSFRFVLYELIVPESCETSVSAGCIYIGLKKKSRGLWPRLLRDKHLKCQFLSTDFNRFEDALDSSSDDDEDDEHKSPLHLMFMRKEKPINWNMPEDDAESVYKNATPDMSDHRLRKRRNSSGTSSSDSESDIDAKFDPRLAEDSKLGYHVF